VDAPVAVIAAPNFGPSERSAKSGGIVIRRGQEPHGVQGRRADASAELERDGCTVLPGVFTAAGVDRLGGEIDAVFETVPPERTRDDKDEFRYEMLNRSAACQRAIAHPRILETIEPLLGDDCHVIANTAWRNPPEFPGGFWHSDAGPHIPRAEDIPWDDRIPYPVFAIGAHILLQTARSPTPTAVVPGSHRSGRLAVRPMNDVDLSYDGRPPVVLTGDAGDVSLFVSDSWHRGLRAHGGRGRYFLQVHYARRDLAQRIRTTDKVNQLSPEAIARAETDRERTLVGLHGPFFYDA
jgi:ectoine hydroxylase-related dioxygenase (phytanoyl-CoA dioxygenase family)